MINVRLGFDKLNSLLVSYHILCLPTKMNREYNPDLFMSFFASEEKKARYMDFLPYKKKNTDPDSIVPDLILPRCKNLGHFFSMVDLEIPSSIKKDLRHFEKVSTPYFRDLATSLKPTIMQRAPKVANNIEEVYDTAQELTGISITRPKELDVYVVEGFAPQAMGSVVEKGFGFVVVSPLCLLKERKFMDTIVHETVAHHTVDEARKIMRRVLGKYVYDVEEGFAKLFSSKVTEKMLGTKSRPCFYGSLERVSHDVFEKNWSSLRGNNFNDWYLGCLKEVKEKIGESN